MGAADEYGELPISDAVIENKLDVVKFLIEGGHTSATNMYFSCQLFDSDHSPEGANGKGVV